MQWRNPAIPPGLRRLSLAFLLIGLLGSLGFMFYTGRRNESVVLMTLFFGWVSSPYVGLLIANRMAKRWSSLTRNTIYVLTFVVTSMSLVVYSGILSPADMKPAAVFLLTPLASWIIGPIAIWLSVIRSRRVPG